MREKKHGHALTGIVIRVMPPATESGGGVGKVCVRFLISYASASSVIPKPLIKINTNKIKTPRQACNNGPYPEKPATK